MFVAKEYIEACNRGGDTAHIAALDMVKAFPRVNHDAVIIKLYERNFPTPIVELIRNWFDRSSSRVNWNGSVSESFTLRTGVNQGSVLAPFIFAVLIDDIIRMCTDCQHYDKGLILVYADDIILITRSRRYLQELLLLVQLELAAIGLELNASKCCFTRIGPLFDKYCAPIVTTNGTEIPEVAEFRYLGVFFVSARSFRANFDKAKRFFSEAANCILSHLQGHATEEVIFHLLKTKAIPILLYATEAVEPSLSIIRSLDFCFYSICYKGS